jgi:hypothetical protein
LLTCGLSDAAGWVRTTCKLWPLWNYLCSALMAESTVKAATNFGRDLGKQQQQRAVVLTQSIRSVKYVNSLGRRLAELISLSGASRQRVEIRVVGIRYSSIELLLAVVGGEELLSDMFWSVLEFYAPQAFNETLGSNAPLSAYVIRRTESERGGVSEVSRIGRFFSVTRAPLVAWALFLLAVIYFGGMRLEALEREHVELLHDYTALIAKEMEQNTQLFSKMAITATQQTQSGAAPAASTASAPTPDTATTTRPSSPPQQQQQTQPAK